MKNVAHETEKTIAGAIKVDEKEVMDHLDGLVRRSVEDTINELLNSEADAICNASRYQRSPDRQDTRAGSYKRKLLTKAGEVELNIPRLRTLPFETQIIKRYQTKQSSVEEALIEMYLAGVSVRRVEDITEALWGTKVSSSTVSELNQKIYGKIEEWRMQPIQGEYSYIFLDGIYLKRSWGGEVQNVAVLVAVGVNEEGYREMLGVAEGSREDKESWTNFLRYLKDRGLKGVKLVVSDKCLGLYEIIGDFFPEAKWQRCYVHFLRNALNYLPRKADPDCLIELRWIYDRRNIGEAHRDLVTWLRKWQDQYPKLCIWVEENIEETLTFYRLPKAHHKHLKSTNMLERLNEEVKRRTLIVRIFPNEESCLRLIRALAVEIHEEWMEATRYLNMDELKEHKKELNLQEKKSDVA